MEESTVHPLRPGSLRTPAAALGLALAAPALFARRGEQVDGRRGADVRAGFEGAGDGREEPQADDELTALP